MLQYLVAPTSIEKRTGNAIISATTLARVAGREKQHMARNFTASTEVLEPFKRDVLPDFDYNEWSHYLASPTPGRDARTVASPGLGVLGAEEIRARILEGYIKGDPQEHVRFDDGLKITRQKRADRRKELTELVRSLPATGSQRIVEYHLQLDPQTFVKKIKANKEAAFEHLVAEAESPSSRQAMNQLLFILEEPMPFLRPVPNSDRAFSTDPSLTTIRKDLRGLLTAGWDEYDLRSAHLAIIASIWPVPELQEFLGGNESFWAYILRELGLPSHHKEGIKEATYALAYGAGKARIKEILVDEVGEPDIEKLFFEVPLIDVLFEARNARIQEIANAGGLTTIFGEDVPAESRVEIRQALAKQTQATEVALIEPIYDVAIQRNDLTVTLYQFDGITAHFRRKATKDSAERQIQDAVAEKAAELNILTDLEYQPPHVPMCKPLASHAA